MIRGPGLKHNHLFQINCNSYDNCHTECTCGCEAPRPCTWYRNSRTFQSLWKEGVVEPCKIPPTSTTATSRAIKVKFGVSR